MEKRKDARAGNGWRLLLVQSVSCGILILAVLILRLVGGGIFQQLKEYFEEAMRQNTLAAALHALWEEETVPSEPTGTDLAVTGATEAAASLTAAPVAGGSVTSGFGERIDPISGEPAFHSGVDLAAPEGTPVAALWSGRVTAVDAQGSGSLGKNLTVECDNGLEFRCCHLSELWVTVGEAVAAGDGLGAVGHTGRATGSHLHLEIRQNGDLLDPVPLLAAGYV